MGGGSASFEPHRRVSVLDALRERLGDDVDAAPRARLRDRAHGPAVAGPGAHDPGRRTRPRRRVLRRARMATATPCTRRACRRRPASSCSAGSRPTSRRGVLAAGHGAVHARRDRRPHVHARRRSGRARVLVDGEVVLDGVDDRRRPARSSSGSGSEEVEAAVELTAGEPVDVVIEYANEHTPTGVGGVKVGCTRPAGPDLLDRAVAAAAERRRSRSWSSARTTTGRPRATTARRCTCPASRTSSCAASSPRTRTPSSCVNTGAPVDHAAGPTSRARPAGVVRRAGDRPRGGRRADRRGRTRRPAADHVSRCGSSTTRRSATSRARTARSATARACSWATAGTRPAACRCASRSATASRTRRSRSAHRRCRVRGRGGAGEVTLTVPVTNTGSRRGSEVVQCYVAPPAGTVVRPPQGAEGVRQGAPRPG